MIPRETLSAYTERMKRRPALWLGAGIVASILLVLLALLAAGRVAPSRPPAKATTR